VYDSIFVVGRGVLSASRCYIGAAVTDCQTWRHRTGRQFSRKGADSRPCVPSPWKSAPGPAP